MPDMSSRPPRHGRMQKGRENVNTQFNLEYGALQQECPSGHDNKLDSLTLMLIFLLHC